MFLHLSDIHFRAGESQTEFDRVQADLRNEMELQLEQIFRSTKATGILITGDVAFGGKEEDFEIARAWLEHLTDLLHCGIDDVWVVPGNHDVDRDVVDASPKLQAVHEEIRSAAKAGRLDPVLEGFLKDPTFGPTLLQPLKSYNEFAGVYGCEIEASRPCWESILKFPDGTDLCLRGLSSALISDRQDDKGHLVLGSIQSVVYRRPGRINMTLCHHPPDWLIDGANVADHFEQRVHVQLFGHKHDYRVPRYVNSVVISAGATHPDRKQPNWIRVTTLFNLP